MSPRISPTGNISQQIGPVTASVNPLTQSAGAGTSANLVNTPDANLNVGLGVGVGSGGVGVGVTPSLQLGQGPGAQAGASLGGSAGGLAGSLAGPVGAAGGALLGSAAGSLAGGTFNKGSKNKEHNSRDGFIDKLKGIGLVDSNYQLALPDGSVANFQGGSGQTHDAKDPSKLVGQKRDKLFGFETDYTNDLDYFASMGGITLSRMLGGGKDKSIDQVGNLIGNQALGKLGYGKDFNPQNFNQVVDNLRSMYAQSGIKSKDEFLALANQGFTQARFNDADRAVAQQVGDLIFDKDFGKASALMAGRWKGLDTAAQTGGGPRRGTMFTGRPTGIKGGVYAPIISFEEALLSVKPIVDYAKSIKGKKTGPSSLQNFVNNLRGGADIIKGIGGLYESIDKLTSGGLNDFIGGIFGGNSTQNAAPSDYQLTPELNLNDTDFNPESTFTSSGEDFSNEATATLDSTLDF